MIKLLLVTWNVEGYEQLDIDEAEPQLSYVAFWMTQNGKQTVTANELKLCLLAARKQMPDILNYTKISVTDFVKRVESRSSLLIMSGHKQTEYGLIPIYEFLHLSFQEYLTAKAVVEKYLPESENEKSYLEVLEPYFIKQNWKEVIPLVAVLLKRQARKLIEYLVEKSKGIAIKSTNSEMTRESKATLFRSTRFPKLLGSCLANEIQIGPDVLDNAIEWYIKSIEDDDEIETINVILNSKFGELFTEKVKMCFFDDFDGDFATELASLLSKINLLNCHITEPDEFFDFIENSLALGDSKEKCNNILMLMQYSYEIATDEKPETSRNTSKIIEVFIDILMREDGYLSFSVCWAIVWMSGAGLINLEGKLFTNLVNSLFLKWLYTENNKTLRFASWALTSLINPSVKIETTKDNIENIKSIIYNRSIHPLSDFDEYTSIFVGTNLGMTWSKENLVELLKDYMPIPDKRGNIGKIYAEFLGVLADIESENVINSTNNSFAGELDPLGNFDFVE